MGINMGNFFRGVLYTGLAAVTGVAGYMVGKYKHMNSKVSLTMVGLALVLYAPKGCDVAETYLKTHADVEKVRVYGTTRKDSIDAVMRFEERKDSTLYLKKFLQNATDIRKSLEEQYVGMLSANQLEYQKLLKKNDAQYTSTLDGLLKQNDLLQKSVEELKVARDSIYAVSAVGNTPQIVTAKDAGTSSASTVSNVSTSSTKPKAPVSDIVKYAGKPHTLLSSEVLADGTLVNTLRYADGKIMVIRFPPEDRTPYLTPRQRKHLSNN